MAAKDQSTDACNDEDEELLKRFAASVVIYEKSQEIITALTSLAIIAEESKYARVAAHLKNVASMLEFENPMKLLDAAGVTDDDGNEE